MTICGHNVRVDSLERNTRSREVAEQSSVKDVLLRAGFLSAALALSPFEHGRAEAAEVTRGMSWEDGITALRNDVFTQDRERQASVVVLKDGTSAWFTTSMGQGTSVPLDIGKIQRDLEAQFNTNDIERVCVSHTHPVRSGIEAGFLTKSDVDTIQKQAEQGRVTFSAPPSSGDVGYLTLQPYALDPSWERNSYKIALMLNDPSGVWYWRTRTDADLAKNPEIGKEINERRAVVRQWHSHVMPRILGLSDKEIDALAQVQNRFKERNGRLGLVRIFE